MINGAALNVASQCWRSEALCLIPCLICQRASVCPDIALIDAAVRCHICSVDKLLNKQGITPLISGFVCVPSEGFALTGVLLGDLSSCMAGQPYLYCLSRRHCCSKALQGVCSASISSLSFISLFAHFHRARRQSWDPLSVGSVMILLGLVESHPRAATFIRAWRHWAWSAPSPSGGCARFALGFLVEVERGSLCFA